VRAARRFARLHAARFGVVSGEAPLPLRLFRLNAVAAASAMADMSLARLFGVPGQTASSPKRHGRPPIPKRRL
jgi:hypothetical protein